MRIDGKELTAVKKMKHFGKIISGCNTMPTIINRIRSGWIIFGKMSDTMKNQILICQCMLKLYADQKLGK